MWKYFAILHEIVIDLSIKLLFLIYEGWILESIWEFFIVCLYGNLNFGRKWSWTTKIHSIQYLRCTQIVESYGTFDTYLVRKWVFVVVERDNTLFEWITVFWVYKRFNFKNLLPFICISFIWVKQCARYLGI